LRTHGGGPNPAAKGWLAGVRTADDVFTIGPFKTRPRNLTPDNATGLGRFSERQIFNAMRFGLRPGETPDVEITSAIPGLGNFPQNPKYLAPPMPWPAFRHIPDADLWAMVAYLKHAVKPVSNRVADSEGPPDFWASAYRLTRSVRIPRGHSRQRTRESGKRSAGAIASAVFSGSCCTLHALAKRTRRRVITSP